MDVKWIKECCPAGLSARELYIKSNKGDVKSDREINYLSPSGGFVQRC